ncbi:MAG: hypothetical protein RLY31_1071 [Bacteroidota bacterium]|jgi:hypothetical protein
MDPGLLLAAILSLGGAGVYLTLHTVRHFHPGQRRKHAALDLLERSLRSWTTNLVPLTREELSQLSFRLLRKSSRNGVLRTRKGLFGTVYHEAVAAWGYQSFPGFGHQAVAVAILSDKTFRYLISNGKTSVFLNGSQIATFDAAGVLQPAVPNLQPVSVRRDVNIAACWTLLIGRETVASLADPGGKPSHNLRALDLVSQHPDLLSPAFLATLLLLMIRLAAGYPLPAKAPPRSLA